MQARGPIWNCAEGKAVWELPVWFPAVRPLPEPLLQTHFTSYEGGEIYTGLRGQAWPATGSVFHVLQFIRLSFVFKHLLKSTRNSDPLYLYTLSFFPPQFIGAYHYKQTKKPNRPQTFDRYISPLYKWNGLRIQFDIDFNEWISFLWVHFSHFVYIKKMNKSHLFLK